MCPECVTLTPTHRLTPRCRSDLPIELTETFCSYRPTFCGNEQASLRRCKRVFRGLVRRKGKLLNKQANHSSTLLPNHFVSDWRSFGGQEHPFRKWRVNLVRTAQKSPRAPPLTPVCIGSSRAIEPVACPVVFLVHGSRRLLGTFTPLRICLAGLSVNLGRQIECLLCVVSGDCREPPSW